MENIKNMTDLIITIASIALVVIAGLYQHFNKQIKEKEAHGSLVAKSLDAIGQFAQAGVYQVADLNETGSNKKEMVLNDVHAMLKVLKLPDPGDQFINSEIQKSYSLMKQAKAQQANNVLNAVDKVTNAGVNEASKTQLTNDNKKKYVVQATTDVLNQLGLKPDETLVNNLISGAVEQNVNKLPDDAKQAPVEVDIEDNGVGDLTKE